MKTMERMPLPTKGSKKHIPKLFLEVNEKKEFFRIDLTTIEKIAHQNNCQVEFTKLAEAREYRETLSRLTSDSGVTNAHSVRVS